MGIVIWFTGLSGSGKSTIAEALKKNLESLGKTVEIVDGDAVRKTINKTLGFSREDIMENNKIIAELSKIKANEVDFVLVPVISPYKEDRKNSKAHIGEDYLELYVNASVQECTNRDTKGLYKKALAGEINNLIGVSESNPYEPPENPDLEINTNSLNIDESVNLSLEFLRNKKLI